jgi:alkylated DNA repair dioxygenase AlkB
MRQSSLFTLEHGISELLPHDGSACYYPAAFSSEECSLYFRTLIESTEWRQEHVQLYGKTHPVPRQTAWFGDSGAYYTYSKIANEPAPWTPTLLRIKERVEQLSHVKFNSVLLNRYRHGNDKVSWHSDDEEELGPDPTIASVSFGASRMFQFKNVSDEQERIAVSLGDGSVVVMSGASQRAWKHQIPVQRGIKAERINLTFRQIFAKRAAR